MISDFTNLTYKFLTCREIDLQGAPILCVFVEYAEKLILNFFLLFLNFKL